MPKNTTAPLNKEHAVQEVIFSLQLGEQLAIDSIKKLFTLKEVLKSEFPHFEELKQLTFQFNPNQLLANSFTNTGAGGISAGVALKHTRDNGSLDWSIYAAQNMLVITCLDYKGWEKTWPKARTYLQTLVEQIIGGNSVKAVNLQYTNIFLSSNSEPYDLYQVFDQKSSYLTDNIKKIGSLWHLFQGWIEDNVILNCKCLNNLNLATSIKNQDIVTTITILRQAQINNLALDSLDNIMNQLHNDLKKILGNVLASNMAKEIGLDKA